MEVMIAWEIHIWNIRVKVNTLFPNTHYFYESFLNNDFPFTGISISIVCFRLSRIESISILLLLLCWQLSHEDARTLVLPFFLIFPFTTLLPGLFNFVGLPADIKELESIDYCSYLIAFRLRVLRVRVFLVCPLPTSRYCSSIDVLGCTTLTSDFPLEALQSFLLESTRTSDETWLSIKSISSLC